MIKLKNISDLKVKDIYKKNTDEKELLLLPGETKWFEEKYATHLINYFGDYLQNVSEIENNPDYREKEEKKYIESIKATSSPDYRERNERKQIKIIKKSKSFWKRISYVYKYIIKGKGYISINSNE